MLKKNFVKFLSPGTFMSEYTTKEITTWNVDEAIEMHKDIVERYGAKPYAFMFVTIGRADDELNSRVLDQSNLYYINGKIQTLEEIKAKNDPEDRILIGNMERNGWDKVVVTYSPYRWTMPLMEGDIVLNIE